MPVDLLILSLTAMLAVVALLAAVVAVRALREVKRLRGAELPAEAIAAEVAVPLAAPVVERREPEHRVIEGRVIVQPSQEDVVAAHLSRPGVRFAIVWAGFAHALRPESRARIAKLVRSEYRQRAKFRRKAARRAARTANQPQQPEGWLSS